MNQEEKIIDVYLMCEENKDYLVFDFEESLKVNFNEESNQNELKEVFVRILSEMTRTSIKLVYVDKAEYKNNLYKDVCKEYVKDLNREINTVAKSIPNYLSR